MDFDFRTFSARSFERFSQSLAEHVIGPGIAVFGDGPDGGREATYDGKMDFPSTSEPWDGYMVMQAKFLQISRSPADDANWLAAQLESEFQKFVTPKSKLRKPSYYILVSNARLSPLPDSTRRKGGIAKVDAVFAKYRKKLGLIDYKIWHLDQIATYLTTAESLRRSYAAWLSTSDVVADLLTDLNKRKKATSDAMYRYLAREIRTHQPIRLQQAGHSGDVATMIEDVFTDLPFTRLSGSQTPSDLRLLAALVERARDRLDQVSVKAQPQADMGQPERILLLGGPGQGKSTVSQFLAQIFRANMLTMERANLVPVEVSQIAKSTLAAASNLGIETLPKRFPLRVDLPSFADKLSAEATGINLTLLRYISGEISRIADSEFGTDDLRGLLAEQPSVLILDGLDEVPPSANRAAVIRAISELWDDVLNGDLLMIVTTRPQGYNNDLAPNLYTKYELTPLNPDQAVAYAVKLAENRLSDHNQRERVIGRIREAARSQTTSRLMVSPLQVAILLALIDQRGDAPNDRWSLFDKYFGVVLEREQGKTGAVGETMRHWGRQIIALHHKAGFLLHTEAETQGNSEANLTQAELRDLIVGQLAEEEYEGTELQNIASELLSASTERLVLLVQREEDRFSFEVRSLQEFMTAAYIMTGREAVVQSRLETIANRSHWLHVFQIASSKCFSIPESQHLRDTIITICQSLNAAGNNLDRFLSTGSRLALALLDDGLAYDQPKYRRLLLSLAIDLLANGPIHLPLSLSSHCKKEPSRCAEQIDHHLNSKLEASRNAACLLLMRLANENQQWARDLLDTEGLIDNSNSAKLVIVGREFDNSQPINDFVRMAIERTSPDQIAEEISSAEVNRLYVLDGLRKLSPCLGLFRDRDSDIEAHLVVTKSTPLSIRFVSIELSQRRDAMYEDVPSTDGWGAVQAIAEFHRHADAAKLAELLRGIEEHNWHRIFTTLQSTLPWPLAAAIWLHNSGVSLKDLAERVEAGNFGDRSGWIAAEARWRQNDISQADIEFWKGGCLFDASVASIGAPWGALSLMHGDPNPEWINWLLNVGLNAKGSPQTYLKRMAAFAISVYPPKVPLTVEELIFLLEGNENGTTTYRLGNDFLTGLSDRLIQDPLVLAELNKWGLERHVFLGTATNSWKEETVSALRKHLSLYPGLIVFLGAILSDQTTPLDWFSIPSTDIEKLEKNVVPIISGYARVFKLLGGKPNSSDVAAILCAGTEFRFPATLLRLLLESNRLESGHRLAIGELVAENLKNESERELFMNVLNIIADQRLASLRERDCWDSLELGGTLRGLIDARSRIQ